MSGELKSEKIRVNGEGDDVEQVKSSDSSNNGSNYVDVLPNNGIILCNTSQGVVKKGKKMLARGKSLCHEDAMEPSNSDTSQESFPSNEGCVFPSPVAITEEEAMRETSCHFMRQGHRHLMNNGGSFDEGGSDTRFSGINGHHLPDPPEPQGHSSYMSSRSALRREAEKPPRLQKQSSRERLPSNNRSGCHSDGNLNGNNVANQSSESGTECLDSMGVDVHEFIVKALQSNPRDRTILIKLEKDMSEFVDDKTIEFMKFPDMTSYHRMLVHRVAAYFGMDHNIDAKGKAVIINKTRNTRKPEKKFSEYVAEVDEQSGREDDMCRRSILKRMKNCQSLEHTQMPMKPAKEWRDAKQRSFEEREVDYEKIRARIFNTKEAGEKRSKAKERIMTQWSRKPWNSTDLESLPGRGCSTPPVSILGSSSLTSKSNSYSGITVLSRRNNNIKDCISSSSSSSSIYPNPISELPPTDSVNEEYEPSPVNPPTICPYYPVPYVNMEGHPLLFPGRPVQVPSYPSVPMQYNPKYGGQPHIGSVAQGAPILQAPPHQGTNGSVENGLSSNGVSRTNPPSNDGGGNIYQAPLNPYAYHYQHAPVHFVYYQPPGAQGHPPPPPAEVLDPSHAHHNVEAALTRLNIEEKDVNNCALPSDDRPTTHTPTPADEVSDAAKLLTKVTPNAAEANEDVGKPSNGDVIPPPPVVVNGSAQPPHPNGAEAQPGNSPPTVPEGVAYYHEPQAPVPLQPGLTGQAVFTHTPARPLQPQMYPGAMIPYPINGVASDRKVGRHVNPQGVGMEQQQEYYIHPVPQQIHPGYGGYLPNPHAPFYCMVNNQGFQSYEAPPNQVMPNIPLMYPSLSNGYTSHSVPQSQVYRPLYQYEGTPTNGVGDMALPDSDGVESGSPPDERYPLYVNGAPSGIDSPELIAFAARNEAKLVQVASSDDSDKDSSPVKDVYLLFPSSEVAFRALEAYQSYNFRLSDLPDSKQRLELLEQIKAAAM